MEKTYLEQELTASMIAAAIDVHKALGPGLLEPAYIKCLANELSLRSIVFAIEVPVPLVYKECHIECEYRLDMLVDNTVIIEEAKSDNHLLPIQEAQILTYLKLMKIRLGLLINFNEILLKNGIRRFIL